MPVWLPVAGVSVNIFLLIGIGGVVGLLSGLLGVGGGFLLTPALMMIGIPPTVAAASDSCQIVAASSSGVAAHFRLKHVDLRAGIILLIGGLSGGFVGTLVMKELRDLGEADFIISVAYVLLLGVVGGIMMASSLRNLRTRRISGEAARGHSPARVLQWLPLAVSFERSGIRVSVFGPLLLGALTGFIAAIMGVGGGFIMVPLMVYGLGMPTHVAVGTSLFQILFTCGGITWAQAFENGTVDVVLALLLALGSATGAQIGARIGRRLRGEQLLIILASLALLVAAKLLLGFFMTPDSILTLTD